MQKTTFPAFVVTFLVSYAFWILLTWSFSAQELTAGAVVCLAVSLFSARFFIHRESFHFFNPLRMVIALVYWLGVFMWELLKANWDMAKRCYGGCKNVNPGFIKVPAELKTDYGQAALANSITLTPGTITMEITEEEGRTYYYIHCIDVPLGDAEKAGESIKGRMERWIRRIWE